MPTLLRPRQYPTGPDQGDRELPEDDVQPVSQADWNAVRWLRSQGIDPRDYTSRERVDLYREHAPQGTSANPGGYGPEHDNPIPYRPTPESAARVERMRQSIEGQLGGGYPSLDRMRGQERTPEYYDREYGVWGSVIRSLEGGQDWGPYRRLEAMRRLEALGPDVVADYGPGWDPTADAYEGSDADNSPEPVHDPELDGPFAGLHEALRQSQADAWTPPSGPSPSDAMPLPFLEPRTDEERTNDQLMEADRARWQGGGRQPPSAARRFGVTPPGLRMADSAASMPGPNTAMVGGNPDWNGEWDPDWGPQPPGTQTPGQGGAMGENRNVDWNPDWGGVGGLTSEDRMDYFRQQYGNLIDQLQETFAPEKELLGMQPEDMPRQGPGSAASQGRQLVRPGDMGLPPRTPDELGAGASAGLDPDQYVAQLDDYGRRREEWVQAHPELWPPEHMTDETDNVPAEFNRTGGLGFGGDETDRWWYGPRNNVGPEDFERMPSRKAQPDPLLGGRAYQNDPDSPRPDTPIDPNTMMANPGLNMPGLPGPNTAMGRILPTGDEDMRPFWMKALDRFNGSGAWSLPGGMDPNDVMPPGDPGSMRVLPPEEPPYDWGDDPDVGGPNTYAMGDGQVRSLDQYRQQRGQAQHPAGTGAGWADLLDSQLGSGPGEGALAGAPGFQNLADIAKQMGLDPDAAVTSLDEWRNRGNVGEQLPLFDPNSTMSGSGAVPRGLGGFGSRYRPQALGGFQPARPMAPLGGFGRPRSLPPMGGYRGAGQLPSRTNMNPLMASFGKGPHHTPFDGMLENLDRNRGTAVKVGVGAAAVGGAILSGIGRTISPFGG